MKTAVARSPGIGAASQAVLRGGIEVPSRIGSNRRLGRIVSASLILGRLRANRSWRPRWVKVAKLESREGEGRRRGCTRYGEERKSAHKQQGDCQSWSKSTQQISQHRTSLCPVAVTLDIRRA